MELLFEHNYIKEFIRGRTLKSDPFLVFSLKCTGRTLKNWPIFQVEIHFHPSHPKPHRINTSFCTLVGLLLTKLHQYFNNSIDSNMGLGIQSNTKIGDTAPLKLVYYGAA